MKHMFLFWVVFSTVFAIAAPPSASLSPASSSFGKTHFIVGYEAPIPPQAPRKVEPSLCVFDETTSLFFCPEGTIKQAFFSPDDDLAKMLIHLLEQEKQGIKAAIFSFTDGDIAHALIEAHKRGITVEIITDISAVRDRFNKVDLLKDNGITVYIYNPVNKAMLNDIMHNKFVIFAKNIHDKPLLWTGSFNFTKSAKLKNQENVLILEEKHLIEKYEQQFERIKRRITHPHESEKLAKKTGKIRGKKRQPQMSEMVVIS